MPTPSEDANKVNCQLSAAKLVLVGIPTIAFGIYLTSNGDEKAGLNVIGFGAIISLPLLAVAAYYCNTKPTPDLKEPLSPTTS